MTLLFFNLLANSTFSLIAGLLIVSLAIWFFRVPAGSWKLFLLSLPFAKIIYDFVKGVPSNSIILTQLDPFNLPPKHQMLRMGAGITNWAPNLEVHFSVMDIAGREYAASIGDYLVIWLNRSFGEQISEITVAALVLVSLSFLALRIYHAWRFEKERKLDRVESQTLFKLKTRFRIVDIYESKAFSGTPFTGGIIKPYICIPADAKTQLSTEELSAVIAHEMGHIHHFDLAITIVIQTLGDLFWFVPGYRWLSRKIDQLRELLADDWAVKTGTKPALLASALLKLKEIPDMENEFILYSAFFRQKSLLKTRIQRLLGQSIEPKPRFGWNIAVVRFAAGFWILLATLVSTFGGNHSAARLHNPEIVKSFLGILGLIT